jgi:hypothetical protein
LNVGKWRCAVDGLWKVVIGPLASVSATGRQEVAECCVRGDGRRR